MALLDDSMKLNLVLAGVTVLVIMLVVDIWVKYTSGVKATFYGGGNGARSDLRRAAIAPNSSVAFNSINSAANLGGGSITGESRFLGGPEPPVFYDIGDVDDTRRAITGTGAYSGAAYNDVSGQMGKKRQYKDGPAGSGQMATGYGNTYSNFSGPDLDRILQGLN
jgi:hypothetical protein